MAAFPSEKRAIEHDRPAAGAEGPGLRTGGAEGGWNHSTHKDFFEYYAEGSLGEATNRRFRVQQDLILRVRSSAVGGGSCLDVADIGCGAGTSSAIWAELGHRVIGLDVNEPLIELARRRVGEAGLDVRFDVGSATHLPWPNSSMDICVAPELLEHVADWEACLDEFARVLRPKGVLFVSTTNKLCPRQEEFNLPLYSWYPGFLKARFVRAVMTTRPDLANFATYPAVNWFTFYGLRSALRARGFDAILDRFDGAALRGGGGLKSLALSLIRSNPLLRFAAHLGTPGTTIVAVKGGR